MSTIHALQQFLPNQSSTKSSPYLKCELRILIIKSFQNIQELLWKLMAVQVNKCQWQTTTTTSPLLMYTITVSPWTRHILTVCSMHKNDTRFSLAPGNTKFLSDLYQSCPFGRSMSSASLWNKHKIPHLCPEFVRYHPLLRFAILNLNWFPRFSSVTSSFSSNILASSFAVFASKLSMRWSLNFVWLLFLLVEDIPLFASIILKWHKIYN